MDVGKFIRDLFANLAGKRFVDDYHLQVEVFLVKGKIELKDDGFLKVYYNERTGTLAFALINEEKRVWGIDRDNLRGWHCHPFDEPESHQTITAQSLLDIINEVEFIWRRITRLNAKP
ncbi:hypothetical protein SDD30_10760 [Moorella naiadis]|uniref:hypothetical protein n=1 Tax=Moorella naiadis (nom. illeg.) TaxID=3093670 RepID=UPI003D9CBCF4